MKLEFKLMNQSGEIKIIGNPSLTIPAEEEKRGQFFVVIPNNKIPASKTDLLIAIYGNDELLKEQKTTFMAPVE